VLAITACVVLFGIMDFRLGLARASGTAEVRVMTQNLGAGRVTAEALDRLMRKERIDVAALQECPFYDFGPAQFGWEFFYGGNLCLVSRFPFKVLDVPDPDTFWERSGRQPLRFLINSPAGSFQLLNVHLPTIRDGLEWPSGLRMSSKFHANRNDAAKHSMSARARVRDLTDPLLVAGDFNLPVESAVYRASWGDLVNVFSACGRGLGGTRFTGLFGLRIDHIVASPQWACTDARVLASPYGGDHAPVIAALRLH
jgi:endonuclease/exonuclease/phosphatase family metal-dependent hydrolase